MWRTSKGVALPFLLNGDEASLVNRIVARAIETGKSVNGVIRTLDSRRWAMTSSGSIGAGPSVVRGPIGCHTLPRNCHGRATGKSAGPERAAASFRLGVESVRRIDAPRCLVVRITVAIGRHQPPASGSATLLSAPQGHWELRLCQDTNDQAEGIGISARPSNECPDWYS